MKKPIGLWHPAAPRDRLIFALDVEELHEARDWVRRMSPYVGVFKVGPRLFTRAGREIVEVIRGEGSEVFLDLKFHDIPATVGVAAREVARLRAKMFTVHALGGGKMIRQAADEMAALTVIPGQSPPLMLAVTILTSHGTADLASIGLEGSVISHVERLAQLAVASGAGGIVASGHEVSRLKQLLPNNTPLVVPGIRGSGDSVGDQTRVMTPREAIVAGATYLVVGRPIHQATDPIAAARSIVDEIAEALA